MIQLLKILVFANDTITKVVQYQSVHHDIDIEKLLKYQVLLTTFLFSKM